MLQVKDIFKLEELQNLVFYAGQTGEERIIQSVTIMDIPEIVDWISEGVLVIAGVLFQQCFSRELIDSFLEKNIAGIVTKQKFLTTIPRELFDYCNETGFPILLAPADYNWGQVMNPIISHIIRKPYLMIEENQKFHYSLLKAMIQGVSPTNICNEFYHSNQLTLAIADTDLHLIGFSDNFDWKEYTRKLTKSVIQYSGDFIDNLDNETVFIYTYTTPLLSSLGIRIRLFPIILEQITYGYILMKTDVDVQKLTDSDIMRIQQLSLLIALYFSKQNDINTATRRFNSLLFDELLHTKHLTHEDAAHLLAPLEKKIHRTYYVLYLQSDSTSTIDSFILQNNRIGRFHSMVQNTFRNADHILIFEKEEAQILLLPSPYDFLDADILKIRDLYLQTLKSRTVSIGISEPAELSNLAKAYRQAKLAAGFLASSCQALPYMEYQNLGMVRYFIDNEGKLDYQFLNEVQQKYITPLSEYDREHHTELQKTLELYLANNGSKTKTERQLFIHKNTLRARLSTINKVLNCDTDLLDDLFEIQLAFKLQKLMDHEITK